MSDPDLDIRRKRVLVAVASRHGSTAEIAERIAAELRAAGHDVDVTTAEPDRWSPEDYDGFVVGSALYAGHWLRDARRFLAENREVLTRRPTWLFSSGPLGHEPAVSVTSGQLGSLTESVRARSHHVFRGRLRRDDLNRAERCVVRLFRAPYGDFREWDDVTAWAAEIANDLADARVSRT